MLKFNCQFILLFCFALHWVFTIIFGVFSTGFYLTLSKRFSASTRFIKNTHKTSKTNTQNHYLNSITSSSVHLLRSRLMAKASITGGMIRSLVFNFARILRALFSRIVWCTQSCKNRFAWYMVFKPYTHFQHGSPV